MRIFTQTEQNLLIRINNRQGINLYSLIDPWIEGVSFTVNTVTNDVTILFEQNSLVNQGVSLNQRLNEIQTILIQSVNLIKLFEEKGYILTFRNTNQIPNPFTFGIFQINSPSIPYHFPDSRISELITKYSTEEIFVTPELDHFINVDGFRTREMVRATRQFRVTLTALIVAILALFSNFGFNMYNAFKPSSSQKGPINHSDSLFKIKSSNHDTR
jgi:hypothetical protein